jgi:hypothetical protein
MNHNSDEIDSGLDSRAIVADNQASITQQCRKAYHLITSCGLFQRYQRCNLDDSALALARAFLTQMIYQIHRCQKKDRRCDLFLTLFF